MNELKSPYFLSLCAGIISVIISYLENKYSDKKRNINSYLKLFILVSILTLLILHVDKNIGNNIPSLVNTYDKQEILTGNPNF
jgi:amino acid transporter